MTTGKGRSIAYWITTALLGLALVGSGIADLIASPDMVAQLQALGYPAYLLPFLGVAKLLGAAVVLAPKLLRLKEWAYAGVAIDLGGAAYSHLANGDAIDKVLTPLLILAIGMASYFLRPASRRLPDPA